MNLKLIVAVLAGLLAAGLVISSRQSQSESDPTSHLKLQLQCGEGNRRACDQVDRLDREGCEGGNGHSCNLLGIAYANRKDAVKATELHARGCAYGDAAACWYAGNVVVEADPDRAIALYQKACDGKFDNGCLALGDTWLRAKKPAPALEAYDKGCSLKYDTACERANELRGAR